MVKIKEVFECDCDTCPGYIAPEWSDEHIMIGGMVCTCPCHEGDREKADQMKEAMKHLADSTAEEDLLKDAVDTVKMLDTMLEKSEKHGQASKHMVNSVLERYKEREHGN